MPLARDQIDAAARRLGIDRVGVARAGQLGPRAGLDEWLARSYHGSMAWMDRLRAERLDPRRMVSEARTVVSIAINYFHPAPHHDAPGRGKISRYAWGSNYHKLVKRQLWALADALRQTSPALRARACVDTGPVLEKPWAHRAGVGWVGKNGNVITRSHGSWVFLGELLVDGELEPDTPATDHCGTCTRCIDACPTDAIVAPTVIDARRCISYLTIEHRGPIAPELRSGMGAWVFGCDICQDVCPWNKFQRPSGDDRYGPRDGNQAPELTELAALDQHQFDERFLGTNVRRAKWSGFLRNVMVALGNTGSPETSSGALAAGLQHRLPDVRSHAAWGLGRLGERAPLRARRTNEQDPAVQDEIEQALD